MIFMDKRTLANVAKCLIGLFMVFALGQDIKLSSFKKYIEATGGKLRLEVEMPDGSHFGFSV